MPPTKRAISIWCRRQVRSRSTACESTPATAPQSATRPGSRSPRLKIPNWCWSTRHKTLHRRTTSVRHGRDFVPAIRVSTAAEKTYCREDLEPGIATSLRRPREELAVAEHDEFQPTQPRRPSMTKVLVLYYSA